MLNNKKNNRDIFAINVVLFYMFQFTLYTEMLGDINDRIRKGISNIKKIKKPIKILEPKIGSLYHIKLLLDVTHQA
jgi:hypothetical protein